MGSRAAARRLPAATLVRWKANSERSRPNPQPPPLRGTGSEEHELQWLPLHAPGRGLGGGVTVGYSRRHGRAAQLAQHVSETEAAWPRASATTTKYSGSRVPRRTT